MHFEMSSAICFNLDQSKILSSGNGLHNLDQIEILKTFLMNLMTKNLESMVEKGKNAVDWDFSSSKSIL